MLSPRQLRFSLYSGAVITEGKCSLFTSLMWFLSWPCPMPYAWILASCSMGSLLSGLFLDLAFPSALLLWIHWFVVRLLRILGVLWSLQILPLGSEASPFIKGVPPLNSGIACLAYLNPGIAMSGFPELWLTRCIVG